MSRKDELDFARLVSIVRDHGVAIVVIAVLGTALGGAAALLLPAEYSSETVLSPRATETEAGIGALLGGSAALASMAGLDLGNSAQDSNAKLALDILQSRRFVGDFAERRGIVPALFAGDSWSEETGLVLDEGIYDAATGTWTRPPDPPFGVEPHPEEIYEEFMDLISIGEDPESGLVRISLTFLSPEHAQQWLSWLISDIDRYVRELDVAEAERAIDFLQQGVEETSYEEVREVFFELIEKQTERMMLARVSTEYAFRVVDPAHLPVEPSSLHPLIIVAALFFAALVSAIIGAVLWATWPLREEMSTEALPSG